MEKDTHIIRKFFLKKAGIFQEKKQIYHRKLSAILEINPMKMQDYANKQKGNRKDTDFPFSYSYYLRTLKDSAFPLAKTVTT